MCHSLAADDVALGVIYAVLGSRPLPDLEPLLSLTQTSVHSVFPPLHSLFTARYRQRVTAHILTGLCQSHGLLAIGSKKDRFQVLFAHVVSGGCHSAHKDLQGCWTVRKWAGTSVGVENATFGQLLFFVVTEALHSGDRDSIRSVAEANDIPLDGIPFEAPIEELTRAVSSALALTSLHREISHTQPIASDFDQSSDNGHDVYPVVPSPEAKAMLIAGFRAATSSETLRTRVCACCGVSCLFSMSEELPFGDVSFDTIKVDHARSEPTLPPGHPLLGYMLESKGLRQDDESNWYTVLCNSCLSALRSNRLPRLSYANGLYVESVPDVLSDLSVVEESLIARCRAKCMIVQLQYEGETDAAAPVLQKGFKGNVLVFPQHPEALAPILPPTVDDILSYVCVIFVGSSPPTREWLATKARPLAIRPHRVKEALIWLKANNPLYKDVIIDLDVLASLPTDGSLLPFHVEHVHPSARRDTTTGSYDPWKHDEEHVLEPSDPTKIPFNSVLISNIDQSMNARQLRAAAVSHIKDRGGNFFAIPHDPVFVNTFSNADLFPLLYPTLFPRANGAPGKLNGVYPVKFESHIRHLLSLSDRRFQEHAGFMFTSFNIIQRRAMLLSISLKTRKSFFEDVAKSFSKVTSLAAHEVLDKINTSLSSHVPSFADTEAQEEVLRLHDQVRLVMRSVAGSSGAHLDMRNEIRAMMTTFGVPSLYVTINPADVYNPVLQLLAGSEVDIDSMEVPFKYFDQACLVARNPVAATKFFFTYINAFITELLACDLQPQGGLKRKKRLGVLGYTKGFYGCIEAQGRGSLHCHMVLWIEGALNPNELKERLLDELQGDFRSRLSAYLDDIISTDIPPIPDGSNAVSVPSDNHHPCAVRGVDPLDPSDTTSVKRQKDLRNLVLKCQVHKHSATCYKYWKGPPEPKECRFGLDPNLSVKETTIDLDTGEIELRHVHGMVNNYNKTIIEAVRNNMDIKFIGSGQSAKAITFYITDYISKSQLKAHVAFTALEVAIYKLEQSDEPLDDSTVRAKRLLQKCAYEMLGRQELSSQQVAAYLLGYGNAIKSHTFRSLYWVSFESYLNSLLDSPECYRSTRGEDNTEPSDGDTSTAVAQTEDDEDDNDDSDPLADDITMIRTDDDTGEVVPRASQLRDYLYRGPLLTDVCLWDFVAQVEKRKYGCKEAGPVSELCPNSREGVRLMESVWKSYSDCLLDVTSRSRPCSSLLGAHDEHSRSYLTVLHPHARNVPVPIGPALPRRDREELYPKYCRLMLMLFKPWRCVYDLRGDHTSWDDAFNHFKTTPLFSSRVQMIMNNIQVMHECKDSRDDDYRRRRDRLRRSVVHGNSETGIRVQEEDDISSSQRQSGDQNGNGHHTMQVADLRDFIDEMHSKRSRRAMGRQETVRESLEIASMCGMITCADMVPRSHGLALISSTSVDCHKDITTASDNMESIWKAEYQKRRTYRPPSSNLITSRKEPLVSGRNFESEEYDECRMPVVMNAMGSDTPLSEKDAYAQTCRDLSLNPDQSLALKIVVNHMACNQKNPLRMIVHGAAGTGKSRVVDALRSFFTHRRQQHRLRVASFMGIAAKNVGGETLHSLLNLQGLTKLKKNSDAHMSMVSRWEGADWLIIDEISMVSLPLLHQVNEALQWAKESERPFGNVNVIAVGDFAQLPPVLQTRLYSRINAKSLCGTESGQRNIFAKLLWFSFTTVINLGIAQRQTGSNNLRFLELLGRLREGRCNNEDYALLQSRVLGPANTAEFGDRHSPWRYAPIVVYENATKDALNEAKAIQFALDKNEPLHWYYARDYLNGKELVDEEIKVRLLMMDSGKTMSRLGKMS